MTLDDAQFLDPYVDSMQHGFEPPTLGSAGRGTEILAVETVDDQEVHDRFAEAGLSVMIRDASVLRVATPTELFLRP